MRVALLAAMLLAAVALAGVLLLGREDEPAQPRPTERAAPEPAGVAAHLSALARAAQRSGGNRAAGTAGDRASTDYVERRMRAAGLETRRQAVSFPFFDELARPRVSDARGVRTLVFSGSGTVTGRVRRVGLGCDADALSGLERGDIALAVRGTCTFRAKARAAQAAGAAAILVAAPRGPAPAGTLGSPGIRIPALALSAAAAQDVSARVRVRARTVSETRRTTNVLADWGRGPRIVMAGAHLDSVAAGPGLNDNGSRVAALLDVAERLGRTPPPRTRLRLAFWGAEELALHGSRAYVRGLDAAARRAHVAYLNLDMVGSPRPRPGVYAASADPVERRLEARLRRALAHRGVRPREERLGGASDHAPFARAGIPVGGLFTGSAPAQDPCYHRACDTLRNVDAGMTATMASAARAALLALVVNGS